MNDPDAIMEAHRRQRDAHGDHFETAAGSTAAKLAAFPRFVDRTSLGRFLVRYELFKHVVEVQGSCVECGVYDGAGTFAFAQLSAILEPLNHRRRIIGFDTFSGFPAVSSADRAGGSSHATAGGIAGSARHDLEESIALYDRDRALGSIPKIELVQGDFLETGPAFLEANPHLVVALLYLDFDLEEPTRRALQLFLPRMPAGAVLAFDEVNVAEFPGETVALLSSLDLRRLRLRRLRHSSICWAVLEGGESAGRPASPG